MEKVKDLTCPRCQTLFETKNLLALHLYDFSESCATSRCSEPCAKSQCSGYTGQKSSREYKLKYKSGVSHGGQRLAKRGKSTGRVNQKAIVQSKEKFDKIGDKDTIVFLQEDEVETEPILQSKKDFDKKDDEIVLAQQDAVGSQMVTNRLEMEQKEAPLTEPFLCLNCETVFYRKHTLDLHISSNDCQNKCKTLSTPGAESTFTCTRCNTSFEKRYELEVHQFLGGRCERIRAIKENIPNRFDSEEALPRPSEGRGETRNITGLLQQDTVNIQIEKVSHSNKRRELPPLIPSDNSEESALQSAEENDQDTGDNHPQMLMMQFSCPKCNKSFPRKRLLDLHIFGKYDCQSLSKADTVKSRYSCKRCGSRFEHTSELEVHQALKTDCNRVRMTKRKNHRRHRRRRKFDRKCTNSTLQGCSANDATVKRRYSCKRCNKSFNGKKNLVIHQSSDFDCTSRIRKRKNQKGKEYDLEKILTVAKRQPTNSESSTALVCPFCIADHHIYASPGFLKTHIEAAHKSQNIKSYPQFLSHLQSLCKRKNSRGDSLSSTSYRAQTIKSIPQFLAQFKFVPRLKTSKDPVGDSLASRNEEVLAHLGCKDEKAATLQDDCLSVSDTSSDLPDFQLTPTKKSDPSGHRSTEQNVPVSSSPVEHCRPTSMAKNEKKSGNVPFDRSLLSPSPVHQEEQPGHLSGWFGKNVSNESEDKLGNDSFDHSSLSPLSPVHCMEQPDHLRRWLESHVSSAETSLETLEPMTEVGTIEARVTDDIPVSMDTADLSEDNLHTPVCISQDMLNDEESMMDENCIAPDMSNNEESLSEKNCSSLISGVFAAIQPHGEKDENEKVTNSSVNMSQAQNDSEMHLSGGAASVELSTVQNCFDDGDKTVKTSRDTEGDPGSPMAACLASVNAKPPMNAQSPMGNEQIKVGKVSQDAERDPGSPIIDCVTSVNAQPSMGNKQMKAGKVSRDAERDPGSPITDSVAPANAQPSTGNKQMTADKVYHCQVCPYTSYSWASVADHILDNHCGKTLPVFKFFTYKTSKEEIDLKLKLAQDADRFYQCPVCLLKSKFKYQIITHMRKHTKEVPFACTLCGKRAKHQSGIVYHIWNKHEEDALSINIYEENGYKSAETKVVSDSVTDTFLQKAVIPDCRKQSSTDGLMVKIGEQDTLCQSMVTPKFKEQNSVEDLEVADQNQSKQAVITWKECRVCDFKTTTCEALEQHISGLHKKKLFPVKELLSISEEEKLKLKMGGNGLWKCPYCPKKVRSRFNLKVHTRVHTNERPYICKLCGVHEMWASSIIDHIWRNHERAAMNVCMHKEGGDNSNGHSVTCNALHNTGTEYLSTKSQEADSTDIAISVRTECVDMDKTGTIDVESGELCCDEVEKVVLEETSGHYKMIQIEHDKNGQSLLKNVISEEEVVTDKGDIISKEPKNKKRAALRIKTKKNKRTVLNTKTKKKGPVVFKGLDLSTKVKSNEGLVVRRRVLKAKNDERPVVNTKAKKTRRSGFKRFILSNNVKNIKGPVLRRRNSSNFKAKNDERPILNTKAKTGKRPAFKRSVLSTNRKNSDGLILRRPLFNSKSRNNKRPILNTKAETNKRPVLKRYVLSIEAEEEPGLETEAKNFKRAVLHRRAKNGGSKVPQPMAGLGNTNLMSRGTTEDANKELDFDDTATQCTSRRNNIVSAGKEVKCQVCGYRSTKSASVARHIRNVHWGRAHPLTLARLYTFKRGKKEEGLRLLPDEESGLFKCPYCPKQSSHVSNLRQHTRSHNDERPFRCKLCGKCEKYQNNMTTHIWKRHEEDVISICMVEKEENGTSVSGMLENSTPEKAAPKYDTSEDGTPADGTSKVINEEMLGSAGVKTNNKEERSPNHDRPATVFMCNSYDKNCCKGHKKDETDCNIKQTTDTGAKQVTRRDEGDYSDGNRNPVEVDHNEPIQQLSKVNYSGATQNPSDVVADAASENPCESSRSVNKNPVENPDHNVPMQHPSEVNCDAPPHNSSDIVDSNTFGNECNGSFQNPCKYESDAPVETVFDSDLDSTIEYPIEVDHDDVAQNPCKAVQDSAIQNPLETESAAAVKNPDELNQKPGEVVQDSVIQTPHEVECDAAIQNPGGAKHYGKYENPGEIHPDGRKKNPGEAAEDSANKNPPEAECNAAIQNPVEVDHNGKFQNSGEVHLSGRNQYLCEAVQISAVQNPPEVECDAAIQNPGEAEHDGKFQNPGEVNHDGRNQNPGSEAIDSAVKSPDDADHKAATQGHQDCNLDAATQNPDQGCDSTKASKILNDSNNNNRDTDLHGTVRQEKSDCLVTFLPSAIAKQSKTVKPHDVDFYLHPPASGKAPVLIPSKQGDLFHCNLCHKSLKQIINNNHSCYQMQSKVKPYRCGKCSYEAESFSVMKKHLLMKHDVGKHGIKPLKYQICQTKNAKQVVASCASVENVVSDIDSSSVTPNVAALTTTECYLPTSTINQDMQHTRKRRLDEYDEEIPSKKPVTELDLNFVTPVGSGSETGPNTSVTSGRSETAPSSDVLPCRSGSDSETAPSSDVTSGKSWTAPSSDIPLFETVSSSDVTPGRSGSETAPSSDVTSGRTETAPSSDVPPGGSGSETVPSSDTTYGRSGTALSSNVPSGRSASRTVSSVDVTHDRRTEPDTSTGALDAVDYSVEDSQHRGKRKRKKDDEELKCKQVDKGYSNDANTNIDEWDSDGSSSDTIDYNVEDFQYTRKSNDEENKCDMLDLGCSNDFDSDMDDCESDKRSFKYGPPILQPTNLPEYMNQLIQFQLSSTEIMSPLSAADVMPRNPVVISPPHLSPQIRATDGSTADSSLSYVDSGSLPFRIGSVEEVQKESSSKLEPLEYVSCNTEESIVGKRSSKLTADISLGKEVTSSLENQRAAAVAAAVAAAAAAAADDDDDEDGSICNQDDYSTQNIHNNQDGQSERNLFASLSSWASSESPAKIKRETCSTGDESTGDEDLNLDGIMQGSEATAGPLPDGGIQDEQMMDLGMSSGEELSIIIKEEPQSPNMFKNRTVEEFESQPSLPNCDRVTTLSSDEYVTDDSSFDNAQVKLKEEPQSLCEMDTHRELPDVPLSDEHVTDVSLSDEHLTDDSSFDNTQVMIKQEAPSPCEMDTQLKLISSQNAEEQSEDTNSDVLQSLCVMEVSLDTGCSQNVVKESESIDAIQNIQEMKKEELLIPCEMDTQLELTSSQNAGEECEGTNGENLQLVNGEASPDPSCSEYAVSEHANVEELESHYVKEASLDSICEGNKLSPNHEQSVEPARPVPDSRSSPIQRETQFVHGPEKTNRHIKERCNDGSQNLNRLNRAEETNLQRSSDSAILSGLLNRSSSREMINHESISEFARPSLDSQSSFIQRKADFVYAPSKAEKLIWQEQVTRCPVCGQEEESTLAVMDHMRVTHTSETPFKCSNCLFISSCVWTMVDHINRLHPASVLELCNFFHICQWGPTNHQASSSCNLKVSGIGACRPLNSDAEFYHCTPCSFKAFQLPLMVDHAQRTHKICSYLEIDPTTGETICPLCHCQWPNVEDAMTHTCCTSQNRNQIFTYGAYVKECLKQRRSNWSRSMSEIRPSNQNLQFSSHITNQNLFRYPYQEVFSHGASPWQQVTSTQPSVSCYQPSVHLYPQQFVSGQLTRADQRKPATPLTYQASTEFQSQQLTRAHQRKPATPLTYQATSQQFLSRQFTRADQRKPATPPEYEATTQQLLSGQLTNADQRKPATTQRYSMRFDSPNRYQNVTNLNQTDCRQRQFRTSKYDFISHVPSKSLWCLSPK